MKLNLKPGMFFKKKPIFLYFRPHKFQISLSLNVFKVFFSVPHSTSTTTTAHASTFLFLFALLEFSMFVKPFQHVQLL